MSFLQQSLLMLAASLAGFAIIYQISILTTTVYLHRYLSHRSIWLSRPIKLFCRTWTWGATGMKTRYWARVHRWHHRHNDDPLQDPHSPLRFMPAYARDRLIAEPSSLPTTAAFDVGVKYVRGHMMRIYKDATKLSELSDDRNMYPDLAPDNWDRLIFDRIALGLSLFITFGILTGAFAGILIYDAWWGFLIGAGAAGIVEVAYMLSYLRAGGDVNGPGHSVLLPKSDSGHARNLFWVAIRTGGEGFHENHHAAENSPRLGIGWKQPDFGWALIQTLRLFRQAKLTTRGELGLKKLKARIAHDQLALV